MAKAIADEGQVADAQPGNRPAVPDTAARAEANKRIQELFKADLAQAKSPREKGVMADKLLSQAADTPDDLPARYVLCVMARELATAAGDPTVALRAVDELAINFDVDAWDLRAQTLVDLNGHLPADNGLRQAFLEMVIDQIEAALNADQPGAAGKLAAVLQSAVGRQKDPPKKQP